MKLLRIVLAAFLFAAGALKAQPPSTGLYADWNASLGVTLTSGRVSAWADQTANAFSASNGTAGSRPYVITDPDGNTAISFPPAAFAFLSLPAGFSLTNNASAIWIVYRGQAPVDQVLFSGGTGAFNGTARIVRVGGSGQPGQITSFSYVSAFPALTNKSLMGFADGAGGSGIYWAGGNDSHAALTGSTYTGGSIGRKTDGGGSYWAPVDIYRILVYNSAQSAGDIIATRAYLNSTYNLQTAFSASQVLFYGDSISQGTALADSTMSYPALMAFAHPTWQVYTASISGAQATGNSSSLDVQVPDTVPLDSGSYQNSYAIANIGRNDAGSLSAATIYANLVPAVNALIARGKKVFWLTCIDTTGPSARATIVTLNGLVRSNLATDCPGLYGIIDIASDPNFDPTIGTPSTGPASNLTNYYSDGTHPTTTGTQLMANYINNVFAVPTASSSSIPVGGGSVSIVFSRSLTTGPGGATGVVATASGGPVTLTYSSGSGSSTYVYTTSRTIFSGETVTISYTQPASGLRSTIAAVDLATFGGLACTNNSTVGTQITRRAGAVIMGGALKMQ